MLGSLAACGARSDALEAMETPPAASPSPTVTAAPGSYCAMYDDPRKCRPAWQPAPAGPEETIYAGLGIRTVPAPADAKPRIRRAKAIALAKATSLVSNAKAPLDVRLQLLTDGDWPDGTDQQNYDRRLTWMVVDHHAPCAEGCNGSTPECDSFAAIDADSGETMKLFRICPAMPYPTNHPTSQPHRSSSASTYSE